jgi:hypothetical protein
MMDDRASFVNFRGAFQVAVAVLAVTVAAGRVNAQPGAPGRAKAVSLIDAVGDFVDFDVFF